MRIGCCVDSYDPNIFEMDILLSEGIEVFQILADFKYTYVPPSSKFISAINNKEVIVHMPFWFNLNNKTKIYRYKHLISSVCKFWNRYQTETKIIIHAIGSKAQKRKQFSELHQRSLLMAAIPGSRIVIENDAGSFKNSHLATNIITKMCKISKRRIGYCIDTLHAYAAGENLYSLDYENADIVHLNSIPKYVKFGGHLDRHSYTPLSSCKIDHTKMIKAISKKTNDNTPIVLERMSFDVTIRDIKTIREVLENE